MTGMYFGESSFKCARFACHLPSHSTLGKECDSYYALGIQTIYKDGMEDVYTSVAPSIRVTSKKEV